MINDVLVSISNQLDDIEDDIEDLDDRVSALENVPEVNKLYMQSSDYLYADASVSTLWKLGRADNTTYYHVYEIKGNVPNFYLTTANSTRTRIALSSYDPNTFRSKIVLNTAFNMPAIFAANLSDTVTRYLISNSDNAPYFYVYTGNAEGTVTISLE